MFTQVLYAGMFVIHLLVRLFGCLVHVNLENLI